MLARLHPVRLTRTALLILAAVCLFLYAASFAKISWSSPPRAVIMLRAGTIGLYYSEPGVRATGIRPGWHIGDQKVTITFGGSGIAMRERYGWVFRSVILRPFPARTPGRLCLQLWFYPARIALIAAPLGLLLLLIPTRRPKGCCPACGYSRAGLPPDAVCPECGVEPALATPNIA